MSVYLYLAATTASMKILMPPWRHYKSKRDQGNTIRRKKSFCIFTHKQNYSQISKKNYQSIAFPADLRNFVKIVI